MHINDLLGTHGVEKDKINHILDPFEGIQAIEFPSTGAAFKFNKDTQQMVLAVPGAAKDYNVDYNGYKKAMRLCSFPESVIGKYPVQLMVEPLNWGFANKVGEIVKALVLNDHLVAFVKPALELVSTQKLVSSVVDVAAKAGFVPLFERLHHDLQYTECSILLPTKSREWIDDRLNDKVGVCKGKDVVCGGLNFRNSIMGEYPLEISGYIYRLACFNGMISAEAKFKWSRKTETVPVEQWFGERVVAVMESLDHEFEKIENLQRLEVTDGHRGDLLNNMFQEYMLSDRMRSAVLDRMVDSPPRNMWDVLNAITNVANDEEYKDSPHTIRRLQMIGGDISTKIHVCNTCFAVKRT